MTSMRPLKFQHAYLWQMQQLCFLLMVVIPWTSALPETGDKTYNLKLGFDLTRGARGGPSLRIRNFEENEKVENFKPSLRAELLTSSSGSNEDQKNIAKKKGIPKVAVEMKAAEDSAPSEESGGGGGGGGDSDRNRKRSTKGMRADEFEPQGADGHDDFDEDSESANSN